MTLLLAVPSALAVLNVLKGLVLVLFVFCALLLTLIVLIQEGKGGGLGSAFGGAAADAFGVKAGSVSKFTTWLAAGFLGLALLYAGLSSSGDRRSMVPGAPDVDQPGVNATNTPGDQGGGEPETQPENDEGSD